MTNRRILACVLALLFLASLAFGLKTFSSNRRSIQASSVTEPLSSCERNDLKAFCQHLLKNTEFGYTLFGTKPVTLLSPKCSEKIMIIPTRELFLRGVAILRKILIQHKAKKFTFGFFEKTESIYFINNRILVKTIVDNKKLFNHLLARTHDLKKLLRMVSKSGDFERIICNHRVSLLGICLGFGVKNSLLFGRKCDIMRFLSLKNARPQIIKKRDRPNREINLVPSVGFSSLEQELYHLDNFLQKSTAPMLNELSFVPLPFFFCDINSLETLSILEAYRNEQKEIRQILVSDDIVERVLDRLLED